MRIGILKTGGPPTDLKAPSYSEMIRAAIGSGYDYLEYDVTKETLPEPESAVDGFVTTGSGSGVHDTDPWISRFRDWLKALDPAKPLVGICRNVDRPT